VSDRHAPLIVEGCSFEGIEEIKADSTRSRFASNELLRKACRVMSRLRLRRKEENQLLTLIGSYLFLIIKYVATVGKSIE